MPDKSEVRNEDIGQADESKKVVDSGEAGGESSSAKGEEAGESGSPGDDKEAGDKGDGKERSAVSRGDVEACGSGYVGYRSEEDWDFTSPELLERGRF